MPRHRAVHRVEVHFALCSDQLGSGDRFWVGPVDGHPVPHSGHLSGAVGDGARFDDGAFVVHVSAGPGEMPRDLQCFLADVDEFAGGASHEHEGVGEAVHGVDQFLFFGRQNTPLHEWLGGRGISGEG